MIHVPNGALLVCPTDEVAGAPDLICVDVLVPSTEQLQQKASTAEEQQRRTLNVFILEREIKQI
jgi:hypothetical protein